LFQGCRWDCCPRGIPHCHGCSTWSNFRTRRQVSHDSVQPTHSRTQVQAGEPTQHSGESFPNAFYTVCHELLSGRSLLIESPRTSIAPLHLLQKTNPRARLACPPRPPLLKGVTGKCGRRGSYFECANINDKVITLLYKMASVSLCPPLSRQISLDCLVCPPRLGDASYPLGITETEATHAALPWLPIFLPGWRHANRGSAIHHGTLQCRRAYLLLHSFVSLWRRWY
jgi:hypothetical protein